MAAKLDSLKPIVALCKRRGFIYPGSELYGGFANTYSYGPYGTALKNNLKNLWWKTFVEQRSDMVGIDGPILLHPLAWKASGHIDSFTDALVDCRECKSRFRADHLIESKLKIKVEGLSLADLSRLILENKLKCPKCGLSNFTEVRHFNLMFQTQMSKTSNSAENIAYLRPETAQAIFLEYKNILDTTRIKIPFGIAQIGKAFRNEITPGNFIFRVIEFEQMEIEYFIEEKNWESTFSDWLEQMHLWCEKIGLKKEHLQEKEHAPEQLSHYSKKTVDLLYDFPFGASELYGLAYRTDFDLRQHAQFSGVNLDYVNPADSRRFLPHVIEPTFGLDRTLLALLCEAYEEEKLEGGEMRTVLHFSPLIAPVKLAIFPLMKKDELAAVARKLYDEMKMVFHTEYDESGAIGKRYRRQDELGTPFCVTVDYQTLEDQTVTVRERDSMKQKRVAIGQLAHQIATLLYSGKPTDGF
ncbi:MAG: glycine--tRNA ligase [Parachlamydiales bacterium]|jgi:glycyl-tRNA synthetase